MKVQFPGAGSDQPEDPLCHLYQINPVQSHKSAEDSPLHLTQNMGILFFRQCFPQMCVRRLENSTERADTQRGTLSGAEAAVQALVFTLLFPWLRA